MVRPHSASPAAFHQVKHPFWNWSPRQSLFRVSTRLPLATSSRRWHRPFSNNLRHKSRVRRRHTRSPPSLRLQILRHRHPPLLRWLRLPLLPAGQTRPLGGGRQQHPRTLRPLLLRRRSLLEATDSSRLCALVGGIGVDAFVGMTHLPLSVVRPLRPGMSWGAGSSSRRGVVRRLLRLFIALPSMHGCLLRHG